MDLHGLLGSGYASSWASAVSMAGDHLYVSGFALSTTGPFEAWLWIGTIPAPSGALALGVGITLAPKRRSRV